MRRAETERPSPHWGEVTEDGGAFHYRWDFPEYEDIRGADEEHRQIQDMLREAGWELVNAQIEHNCISGSLRRVTTEGGD